MLRFTYVTQLRVAQGVHCASPVSQSRTKFLMAEPLTPSRTYPINQYPLTVR